MATDFGTDTATTFGLQYRRTLVNGPLNLANALLRRSITPRGSLRYAPNYGIDVRELLEEDASAAQIDATRRDLEAEYEKDDRVLDASVEITRSSDEGGGFMAVDITAKIETEAGPFTLVMKINQVTAEVLAVEAAG